MIVRRVVEARRQHHQEQFPHLYQQSQQVHRGTYLAPYPSADLVAAYSSDSYCKTPALTPLEQEISYDNSNANIGNPERPSQWLGLRRKISQHIGKGRRGSDTPGEDSGDVHGHNAAERGEQISNPAGRDRENGNIKKSKPRKAGIVRVSQ